MYKSNKNVQNPFAENHKTLMKEVKDYLSKWRDHVHGLEPMFMEANAPPSWSIGLTCFNQNSSRIFCRYRKADPKMYMKRQQH